MSVLSPSSMFTNAIEPSEPVVRMDVTESSPVKDFIPVPDSHRRNDREFDQISKTMTNASPEHQQMVCSNTHYGYDCVLIHLIFKLQNQNASQKDQAEKIDTVIESNTTPPSPNTVNDELIAGNESLTRDRDNDLLYQQLLLPDKLLQSDEKDGDDDSNSAGGTQQNQNSIKLADGEDLQDQNMVSICLRMDIKTLIRFNNYVRNLICAFQFISFCRNTNRHYHQRIMGCCPVLII